MSRVQLSLLLLAACWLGLQSASGLKVEGDTPSVTKALLTARLNHSSNLQSVNLQPATLLQPSTLLTKSLNCPGDVKTLTSMLIKDLPSYANRVLRQARRLDRKNNSTSYVLLAGNPEFEPLTLGPGEYNPATPSADLQPPQQVFLTTLERQYIGGKAIESQDYHWLFLTQTPGGWRLAIMFSRFGSSLPGRAPTPPRESSNGVIGQAVTIWLRDCRAGGIRPPPPPRALI